VKSWAGVAPAPDGPCSRQRMAQLALAPQRSGRTRYPTGTQPGGERAMLPRRGRLVTGHPTGAEPGQPSTQLAGWVPNQPVGLPLGTPNPTQLAPARDRQTTGGHPGHRPREVLDHPGGSGWPGTYRPARRECRKGPLAGRPAPKGLPQHGGPERSRPVLRLTARCRHRSRYRYRGRYRSRRAWWTAVPAPRGPGTGAVCPMPVPVRSGARFVRPVGTAAAVPPGTRYRASSSARCRGSGGIVDGAMPAFRRPG
jgi:hypothetical protein